MIAFAGRDLPSEDPVHENRVAENHRQHNESPNEHEELRAWCRRGLPHRQRAGHEILREEIIEAENEPAPVRRRITKLDQVGGVRLRALERQHGRALVRQQRRRQPKNDAGSTICLKLLP